MNKITLLKFAFLLFFSTSLFSQTIPTDISFNNNIWTENSSNISLSGNEYTITGNTSSSPKVYLDVDVANTYKDVYISAEIQLDNFVQGSGLFNVPQMKLFHGGTNTIILTHNLKYYPEGNFYKVGVLVNRYDKLNISSIRIEFRMQKSTGTMTIKNPVISDVAPGLDYSFPYTVPSNPTYTLNVNTNSKHTFNNDLLSTNSHFRFLESKGYTWGSPETSTVLSTWFPQTNIRFPGGTVANYYDWSTDGFHNPSVHPDVTHSTNAVNGFNNNYSFGYSDYKDICLANSATSTLMFNVTFDNATSLKNRLSSRQSDGLSTKWIELGNEIYFPQDQIGNVSSLSEYISVTKNITSELKTVDSTIKVGVPLNSDNYSSNSWNMALANETYFDVGVIHPYNNSRATLYSGGSVYQMMQSYKIMQERLTKFSTNFPGKKAILTEWGVLSEKMPVNFAQTLSMADAFLSIEKGNQDGIVDQAGLHMLWHSNTYREATLTYHNGSQMVLTANGIMYASLFDAFKNNEVFDAFSSGPDIDTDLKGLYAKAVNTGTEHKIFVVNKLPVTSTLNYAIDGVAYEGNYTIETFTEDITTELTTPYTNKASAWNSSTPNATSGNLSIPAYSISIVTIIPPVITCDASEENIIANGNAECAIADGNWSSFISGTTDSEATFSDENLVINGGNNAFKISTTKINTLATPKLGDIRFENVKYDGDFYGKIITIDVWAKAETTGQVGIQLKIDKTAGGSDFTNGIYPTLNSTYTKYTITAPIYEATTGVSFRILTGKNTGNFYFDDIVGVISTNLDLDNDGYNNDVDCNDNDAAVNPGATEILYNGIDDDCNPLTIDTEDLDNDGYNSDIDCNDNDAAVNPGVTEVLNNGVDDDCNPSTSDIGYTLSVSALSGFVSPSNGTYPENTNVILTATPDSGYEFSSWSGDASGTVNPLTVTMNGNKNITANFTEILISTTLTPIDDAHVRNGVYENDNYGSYNKMHIQQMNTNDRNRITYLKFDLSNISNITSATLRLNNAGPNGDALLKKVSNDNWTEHNIKWNGRPTEGANIGTYLFTGMGTFDMDVTSYVSVEANGDGLVSFALKGLTSNFMAIWSKESGNAPELIVEYSNSSAKSSNNKTVLTTQNFEDDITISVYPNPTTSQLNLKINNADVGKGKIQVFDVTGRLVSTKAISNKTMQLQLDGPSGIYIVKVITKEFSVIKKIIKQ